jgi:hypothetical protein
LGKEVVWDGFLKKCAVVQIRSVNHVGFRP